MKNSRHILFFDKININDIEKWAVKNASLGEMYNQLSPLGNLSNGFALTADVYRLFRKE
jgi:pyruvate,water dikinase